MVRAGWMRIESHRWALEANGVVRGFVLVPETDEVVRPAMEVRAAADGVSGAARDGGG